MLLGQVAAEEGDRAGKRKAACQDDDMRGKGEEEGRSKSANKPLAASARRCRYCSCEWSEESSKFYQIRQGSTSGGQDWSFFAGSVPCHICYSMFHSGGILERSYNKPLAASARRCTYSSCERPEESSRFHLITLSSSAGGQDWSSLAGSVLCTSCYNRFRNSGTLEISINRPLAASARRCTYADCERPDESSWFRQILEGSTIGGQDWSSLTGSVLCSSCCTMFRRRGTLERSHNKRVAASARRCTYSSCKRPEESRRFYLITLSSSAGGQDWSSLAGSVLCTSCYTRFRYSGTLERQQHPLPHSKAARADLKPRGHWQVAAEGGGRTAMRKAVDCQRHLKYRGCTDI
jgi:hypothetical protein